jgi:Zn finger protein HypA/HybF involved in hydrogenase expression
LVICHPLIVAFRDDDDDCPASDPFQDDEPDADSDVEQLFFPESNDEDLMELDETGLDEKILEVALENSLDPEFEPALQQLVCAECNVPFASVSDFTDHQSSIHLRTLSHCPLCNVFYKSYLELRLHWRNIHSHVFKALKLKARNSSLAKLQLRPKYKKPTFSCKYCKEPFDDILEYRFGNYSRI